MKIFGREPVVWVALIEAGIALAVATFWHLTGDQVSVVMAVVVAVFALVVAYATHETLLAVLVGLTKAVLALMIGFGLHISPDQIAAIIAFVSVAAGFFTRTQTAPADTAITYNRPAASGAPRSASETTIVEA